MEVRARNLSKHNEIVIRIYYFWSRAARTIFWGHNRVEKEEEKRKKKEIREKKEEIRNRGAEGERSMRGGGYMKKPEPPSSVKFLKT